MPGAMKEANKYMQDTLYEPTLLLNTPLKNLYAFLSGLFVSVLGYFLPVKDIVHLLIIFFILDVIFGFWAARRLRNERFSVKIIWSHTMPRMLVSIVLILGAYMWDTTYEQDFVCTYKVVGWFISGVLLYSIAENGYHITKWAIFPRLAKLIGKKIKEQTGLDVDDKQTKTDGEYDNNRSNKNGY